MYLTNSVRFLVDYGKQHTNLAKCMEKMYFMYPFSRYHIIATYIKTQAYTPKRPI